ncbi:MAG: DNA double-strand break repair Rad50 ATPase [Candidatus Heimdallarchaeota archaeon LC_2]|nr:MAG: DNA double-strand break repair Rad50 ATPase [Candidatus Heimdallarchaeota archaeon LC_2]
MNIKKISIRNFKNYDKEKLDLESSSFWILTGKNSSGKSTLACDALTYALFGKIKAMDDPQDARVSVDDIVKRGKTKATVSIEFTNNGDNFVVERIREIKKRARETVYIKRNDRIIMDRGTPKKKADQWIVDNLWTYNDFTNTTLIMQDEMTKALDLPIGKRKDYLERLFGIKNFHEMSKLSRENANEIESELGEDLARIEENKKNLVDEILLENEKLTFEKAVLEKEQVSSKIKVRLETIRVELQEAKNIENEKISLQERIIDLEKQLNGLKVEIQLNKAKLDPFDEIIFKEKDLNDKLKRIEKLEKEIDELSNIKELRDEKKRYKGSLASRISKERQSIQSDLSRKKEEIRKNQLETVKQEKELENLELLKQKRPKLENYIKQENKVITEIENHLKYKEEIQILLTNKATKEKERTVKLENRLSEIKEKQKSFAGLEKYKLEYKSRVQAKADLQDHESKLNIIKIEHSDLKETLVKEKTTLSYNKSKLEDKNKEILEISSEIEKFENLHDTIICPTCNQNLEIDHVKLITSDLLKKSHLLENENQQLSEKVQKDGFQLNEKEKNIEEKGIKLTGLTDLISKLRLASDGIDASKNRLDEIIKNGNELDEFKISGGAGSLFPELKLEVSEIEAQIKKINFDEVGYNELEQQRDEIISQKQELKGVIAQLEKYDITVNNINDKKDLLENLKLELGTIQKTLSHDKFLNEVRKELVIVEKEIIMYDNELEKEEELHHTLYSFDPVVVRSELKEIKKAHVQKARIEGQIVGQEKQNEDYNENKTELIQKIEGPQYDKIKNKVKNYENKVIEIEIEYEDSLEIRNTAQNNLKTQKEKIENQKHLRLEIKEKENLFSHKRDDHDIYKQLERIFGQIGGRILSRLKYQINVATIDILSQLGNSQLEGITLNNDYSITIETPEGNENSSFFSGGQKVRIGFAFRLALSKVLAEFRGNELDTLIIDEGGFGALDEDGQDGIIEVFKSLQDRFERVLIISHIPRITENLPGAQLNIVEGKIVEIVN